MAYEHAGYFPIKPPTQFFWTVRLVVLVLFCSLALNVLLLGQMHCTSSISLYEPMTRSRTPLVYSPAQEAVEYLAKVRNPSRAKTIYDEDPSPAVDTAWNRLYNYGISRIPREQAALLPNRTARVSKDDPDFIIELEAFHQLHCLNSIRMALHPDYYNDHHGRRQVHDMHGSDLGDEEPNDDLVIGQWPDFQHVRHCLSSLREGIMCSADVSVIVEQWDDARQMNLGHGDTVHECRNWDKIKEWALRHHVGVQYDSLVRVEDPLSV